MANALGKIVGSVTVLRYSVRPEDGTDVEAILPKSVLRKIGCLFGPLPDGRVVTVSLHEPPKQHRIINVANAR
ncbi:MAG: hypothetical protein R3B84_17370 [Zavarzinella sp.]